MAENLSKLADELKPYMVPWVRRIAIAGGGGGGTGDPGGGDLIAHVLADTSALGPFHTVSGLTAGQVLTATGSTTARFGVLSHSALSDLLTGDPHTQYALRARSIIAGDGLTGGGTLASDRTLTLGTPTSLSISTTNSVTSTSHAHTVTASSNPGASAQLLATDSSGKLALSLLRTPSIDTAAGAMTIAPADNLLLNPTGNYVLPTSNYDINLGAINYKYLTLHAAELWVETLVAQYTLATIGGRILVGPTTTLVQDLGDAVGNTTIHTKHNNLAVGDVVYMEASGKVEFMSVASGPTGSAGDYSYSMYRNLDGSGLNLWYAGDAIFNTGSTGNGFIDLYSLRGMKGGSEYGPTIVGNRRMSSTYNDWEPRWAIGNLQNLYGYGSETYGFAAGQASATWVSADATNGFRVMRGTTARLQADASGNLRLYNASGTSTIALDNDGTSYFAGPMGLGTSGGIYQGSGTFASPTTGLKIWNDSGVGRIAGYNAGTLQAGFDSNGRLSAGSGDVRIDATGILLTGASTNGLIRWNYSTYIGAQIDWTLLSNRPALTLSATGFLGGNANIDLTATPDTGGTGTIRLTADVVEVLAAFSTPFDTTTGTALELQQDGTSILKSDKTSADAYLQLGKGRTADGNAVIRLISQASGSSPDYSLYGAALQRNTGTNGATQFLHRGTGNLDFIAVEAAAFTVKTTNTTRLTIASDGLAKFASSVAVGGDYGGTASYVTLTNATQGVSTGSGTIKMNGFTGRNSVGWLKLYTGTTAVYVPYFDTITG